MSGGVLMEWLLWGLVTCRERVGGKGRERLNISLKMALCKVLYVFIGICFTVPVLRECSSMVEYDLPKVETRVRFPSLAPKERGTPM